jgi:site-specific DNA-methyltransferase (adenine-specific)
MKKYRTILADPPWGKDNFGPKISSHYPLMSDDDICALPVESISDDNAILILWSTWTHLKTAMRVIDSWGFTYVAGFPWIKLQDPPMVDLFGEFRFRPTWGLGSWIRGCSEPILLGRRGNAAPDPTVNFLGLMSKRLQHSRKPEDIYEYANSFPGPHVELFARQPVDGWDVWGNEVESTASITSALSGC